MCLRGRGESWERIYDRLLYIRVWLLTKCAYGSPKPEPEALKKEVTQAYLSKLAHKVTQQALVRGLLVDRVGFEIDHGLWRTVTKRTEYSSHTVIHRSLLRFLRKRVPGYERKLLFTSCAPCTSTHGCYNEFLKKILALNASDVSSPHYDPAVSCYYVPVSKAASVISLLWKTTMKNSLTQMFSVVVEHCGRNRL